MGLWEEISHPNWSSKRIQINFQKQGNIWKRIIVYRGKTTRGVGD